MEKMTALQKALTRMAEAQVPGQPTRYLAIHELGFDGSSQNALATRMSEAERGGKVIGRYRSSKRYKEYALPTTENPS